ncbi:hypothetical protein DRQ36_06175 [bacterium]|nr:MAG: hypothetical protein DRQ36_06175 [bacterium]
MKFIHSLLFSIICVSAAIAGWEIPITIHSTEDPGWTQPLHIGTEEGSSYLIDTMDIPFIPPPSGRYGCFPVDDPDYPGVDFLQDDFRSDTSDCVVWKYIYSNTNPLGDSCWLWWDLDSFPPTGIFDILITMEDSTWRDVTALPWWDAVDMRSSDRTDPFWMIDRAYIRYRTGVNVEETFLPVEPKISAYPNPFNSSVKIVFDFESESPQELSTIDSGAYRGVGATERSPRQVGIEIFDLTGRLVADLPLPRAKSGSRFSEEPPTEFPDLARGPTPLIWQPDKSLGSGVYLIRAKGMDSTIRIVYLK